MKWCILQRDEDRNKKFCIVDKDGFREGHYHTTSYTVDQAKYYFKDFNREKMKDQALQPFYLKIT